MDLCSRSIVRAEPVIICDMGFSQQERNTYLNRRSLGEKGAAGGCRERQAESCQQHGRGSLQCINDDVYMTDRHNQGDMV